MKIVYQLCLALSLGVLLGFLGGGLRLLRRPAYSEKQIAAAQRMKSIFAGILKYFTFLFLVLGLVWCFYYLALGLSDPALSEYATNMSQLIVSALTVISILFAFVEFLRKK